MWWNCDPFDVWFIPFIMMLCMFFIFFTFVLPYIRSMGRGNMGSTPTASFGKRSAKSGDKALTIAKRRYASGEISKEDFEEITKTLSCPKVENACK